MLIVVNPMYVFVPPKINIPAPEPSFVRAPLPLIALETVMPPVPFNPKLIPPVFVKAALFIVINPDPSLLILEAVCVVINPEKIVSPIALVIRIAPLELTPVPFKKKGSVMVNPFPTISTAAPELTVVAEFDVPKAPALEICTTPCPILVAPVYVVELSALNNKVPIPFFVMDTVPSVPEKVLVDTSVFELNSVKVFEDKVLVIVPAPVIVDIVSLLPFKSKLAPEATTTFATSLTLELEPNFNEPELTEITGVVKLVVPDALPPQILLVILKLPIPFLSKSPIVSVLVV